MTVATVKPRLVQIQKTITGVKRAYAQAPGAIPPGDLPLFLNFTGPSENNWEILGEDGDVETRMYLMRLLVRQLGQGIDGEAERLCEPFFTSVRNAFAARPGLGLGTSSSHLAGVQLAVLLGDSGVSVIKHAGEEFIGVEFRLQVTEYIEVSYAAYE
jgi:hypothetical protein